MSGSEKYDTLISLCGVTAVVVGLYLSAVHSYLLFHSIIEIATIAIAFTLFILTWNTRKVEGNDFLAVLGIGYAFIALIDLLHALTYKGMNVFAGFGPNLPTQLWIAARSLQAVTLCAAPFFVRRSIDNRALFASYSAAVSVLVTLVFSGHFPDCYIDGAGLTRFKVGAEYVISALLFAAIYLLYRQRSHLSDSVFHLSITSIACTGISELWFTTYLSVYDFANMAGHFFKLAAFYLVYRAILVTSLKDPFDLIFREVTEAQEALRASRDSLEEVVRVRTAELRAREEKYRALIECANDAVFIHEITDQGLPGPFLEVNELACRRLGYSRDELSSLGPLEIDDPRYRDRIPGVAARLLEEKHAIFETAQIAKDGRSIPVEVSARLLDLDGKRLIFALVRDITERKGIEEALQRLNRELRAISDCNQVLLRVTDEQELLERICGIICAEAGYRMAWVGYADGGEAPVVRPVAKAGADDGYLESGALSPEDADRRRGPTGTAIRTGKTSWVSDLSAEERGEPWRDEALRRGYRSCIALPLTNPAGAAFGALTIYADLPRAFDSTEEVHLLEELAGDLAFGVVVLRARLAHQDAERDVALLTFALDNVREYALLTNREGRFLYVNNESCRELGYSRDELLSMHVCDIDPEFPAERWPAHWEQVKMRGSLTFEGCHRKKDATFCPVEINANYLEYAGEAYILGLVRDITERKSAEEERVAHVHSLEKITAELEARVRERTAELEAKNEELARLNKLFIGRELRMVELKERLRQLEGAP